MSVRQKDAQNEVRRLNNDLYLQHRAVQKEIADKQDELSQLFGERDRIQRMMSCASSLGAFVESRPDTTSNVR